MASAKPSMRLFFLLLGKFLPPFLIFSKDEAETLDFSPGPLGILFAPVRAAIITTGRIDMQCPFSRGFQKREPENCCKTAHGLIISIFFCAFFGLAMPAWGQGALENPQSLATESGIGIVSGWHCDADVIEIQFDDLSDNRQQAAYGTPRGDTQGMCGDTDNGYGLLFNYNLLGDGEHTVRAFADGVEFASATFTVVTLGQQFVQGASATASTSLFEIGRDVKLQWQQSKQNFVITEAESFNPSQVFTALVGTYSGTWTSLSGGGGVISVTISQAGAALSATFTLTNTGCSESGVLSGLNLGEQIIDTQLDDGSMVRFFSRGTENFQAFGGSLIIETGACANLEGVFTIVKQ